MSDAIFRRMTHDRVGRPEAAHDPDMADVADAVDRLRRIFYVAVVVLLIIAAPVVIIAATWPQSGCVQQPVAAGPIVRSFALPPNPSRRWAD